MGKDSKVAACLAVPSLEDHKFKTNLGYIKDLASKKGHGVGVCGWERPVGRVLG